MTRKVYIIHDDTDRLPGGWRAYGYGICDAETGEVIERAYDEMHSRAEFIAESIAEENEWEIVDGPEE